MGWPSVIHDLAGDFALPYHNPPRFEIAPLARSILSIVKRAAEEAIWRWTPAGAPCQTFRHANQALPHRTVFWEIRIHRQIPAFQFRRGVPHHPGAARP